MKQSFLTFAAETLYNMLEEIIAQDKSLFLWLNGWHNNFFDHFFWIFTQLYTWLPALLVILGVIIATKKREALWIVLALVLTIVITDQVSSSVIKPLVARLRPTHDPALAGLVHTVNGYTGGQFGFVSSHAANAFGVALFLALLFRNQLFGVAIFGWAALNVYSRIYLGVHFPLDIVCGALVGFLAAWLCFLLLRTFCPTAVMHGSSAKYGKLTFKPTRYFTRAAINLASATVIVSVVLIAVLHQILFKIFS